MKEVNYFRQSNVELQPRDEDLKMSTDSTSSFVDYDLNVF